MKRFLAALFMALFLPQFSRAQEPFLRLVEKSDSAISAEDWQLAKATLNQAVAIAPDVASRALLLSNLGIVNFNAGDESAAIAALDEAASIAPHSVTVLSNRARIMAATGRDKEALRDFGEVCRLDSTLSEPLYYHAMLALKLCDPDLAIHDIERLKQLSPESPETHIVSASLLTALGDTQGAINEYTWLIENSPSVVFYVERAALHIGNGDINEASEDVAEGLRLDPNEGELYLYRAVLNKIRYRPADAEADAKRAIELGVDKNRVNAILNLKN